MLRDACLIFFVLLGSVANIFAQTFPKSAVILEKAKVTAAREMVLWMENPTKHPRSAENDIYTCPDNTRGHYYSGVTKVSLIDIKRKKILNTLEITSDGFESGFNTLDLPYLIQKGYYKVPRIDKNKEGKPVLMDLKDYNADGKPFEFALFDAIACMGLETTLIGYNPKQDKVIQYQTELKTSEGISKEYWIDYFFGQKANKQGVWKYEIDYRGRAGALEKYEFRYDRKREMFYGTRISIFEEKERPGK
jgi:hypothetical protein